MILVGDGDGVLWGDVFSELRDLGDVFSEMRVLGAFSSFLTPSVGFLLGRVSGDEAVAPITDDDDDVGGSVFNLIGTNALRISSAADSLPESLGLLGGVLDGLVGMGGCELVVVVVFGGRAAYSVGYFAWSNG